MARYAARIVSWYTQGGMVDECGVTHTSNFFYKWEYLSVLNEDEYAWAPSLARWEPTKLTRYCHVAGTTHHLNCLLYTSPSPRD